MEKAEAVVGGCADAHHHRVHSAVHPPHMPPAPAAPLVPSAWGFLAEVHMLNLFPMGSATAMPCHPHGWEGGAQGNAGCPGQREDAGVNSLREVRVKP